MSTIVRSIKKQIFTSLQICKEGKWKLAVTSFLSNAGLVGSMDANYKLFSLWKGVKQGKLVVDISEAEGT